MRFVRDENDRKFETKAVQSGIDQENHNGAIMTLLYYVSIFSTPADSSQTLNNSAYVYARISNPTTPVLEQRALESLKKGNITLYSSENCCDCLCYEAFKA